MSPGPALAALALMLLHGCGLTPLAEDKWPFGEPPPEPVATGGTFYGEVRDLRTLRPIVGAEIVLTTGRAGYQRRAVTDDLGRFALSYSMRARDVSAGEASFEHLITGHDPTDDVVDDLRVRVTCRGRRQLVERAQEVLYAEPLVLFLEPLDPDAPPRFDCAP